MGSVRAHIPLLMPLCRANANMETTVILAMNPITLMPGLTRPHLRAIKPFAEGSAEAREKAETAFWAGHVVVVSSLEAIADIEEMYKPLVQRLYVSHEPKKGARWSALAVTGLVGKLKAALNELKGLEWLAVACVFEDAEAKREELRGEDIKKAAELRILVEAVSKLKVKEKVVLMASEGEKAGVGTLEVSMEGSGEGVVGELLALEVGNGLAV